MDLDFREEEGESWENKNGHKYFMTNEKI